MSIKEFWKKHKTGILYGLAAAGAFIGGAAIVYNHLHSDDYEEDAEIEDELRNEPLALPGWKDEYLDDYILCGIAAANMHDLKGRSWVIAGPESYYNDNEEGIDIYMVTDDGWFLTPPKDLDDEKKEEEAV